MLIEILKIIASFSITITLFYTFFKVGRQSVYYDLLKHYNEALKLIGQQDVIIKAYSQKLEEKEGYDRKRPMLIEYEPSVHAENFIDSLRRMIVKYGDKLVELENADITDIIYDADRGFFTPTCLCDIPLKASELILLTQQLKNTHGNLAVECPKLMLSSITYYADTNKFHIS